MSDERWLWLLLGLAWGVILGYSAVAAIVRIIRRRRARAAADLAVAEAWFAEIREAMAEEQIRVCEDHEECSLCARSLCRTCGVGGDYGDCLWNDLLVHCEDCGYCTTRCAEIMHVDGDQDDDRTAYEGRPW